MDRFLQKDDELGILIQQSATELFRRLQSLDVSTLGLPYHCLHYYNSSHSTRLFFSIETSANLLYRAITLCGKSPHELVVMDYGAGVGTLYLLAKLAGCKKVIYNDHLEDWKRSAQLIAEAIDVDIDQYIVGDIDSCLQQLEVSSTHCDLITSRNVIEHIYKLDVFYRAVHEKQPAAIIYSSTTANNKNPASIIKHMLWHRKWEKIFRGKRQITIQRVLPGLPASQTRDLAKATRGLATGELHEAIREFEKTGSLKIHHVYSTNTCDPENGVWAEHLLRASDYRQLIGERQFSVSFAAGFWDTHYKSQLMNAAGRALNRIIARGGALSMTIAPFIYVIAVPLSRKRF